MNATLLCTCTYVFVCGCPPQGSPQHRAHLSESTPPPPSKGLWYQLRGGCQSWLPPSFPLCLTDYIHRGHDAKTAITGRRWFITHPIRAVTLVFVPNTLVSVLWWCETRLPVCHFSDLIFRLFRANVDQLVLCYCLLLDVTVTENAPDMAWRLKAHVFKPIWLMPSPP